MVGAGDQWRHRRGEGKCREAPRRYVAPRFGEGEDALCVACNSAHTRRMRSRCSSCRSRASSWADNPAPKMCLSEGLLTRSRSAATFSGKPFMDLSRVAIYRPGRPSEGS